MVRDFALAQVAGLVAWSVLAAGCRGRPSCPPRPAGAETVQSVRASPSEPISTIESAPVSNPTEPPPQVTEVVDVLESVPCISHGERSELEVELRDFLKIRPDLASVGAPKIEFAWPLKATGAAAQVYAVHTRSNFVDWNEKVPDKLEDYACGTRTYDRKDGYNHDGVDIALWPYRWQWVEKGLVHVVAAAPGVIAVKRDGHADRNCKSKPGLKSNAIWVTHADGSSALYAHLKKSSLTKKKVGDSVKVGEYLGIVASSGNSTGPHLHFEVRDKDNKVVDPHKAKCNRRHPKIRWKRQLPYLDTGVNDLIVATKSVERPACPKPMKTYAVSRVARGSIAYFTGFFREMNKGQKYTLRVVRSDGTVRSEVEKTRKKEFASRMWLWFSRSIGENAPKGKWRFEIDLAGKTYVREFTVY